MLRCFPCEPSTCARVDHLRWEEYFMFVAWISAQRSKDPSRQVGCCIVQESTQRIVSIGYNGFPRGCPDHRLPWGKRGAWLDTKYPYVCHAEANAILNASHDIKGCTAYVTLFPCNECAKLMIQAGVQRVVFLEDTQTDAKTAAERLFRMANVPTTRLALYRRLVLVNDDDADAHHRKPGCATV